MTPRAKACFRRRAIADPDTAAIRAFSGRTGMEWGNDRPNRGVVELRCAAIINNGDDQAGCGWTGNSIAISTLGTIEFVVEDCPRCGGPVCGMDD